MLLEPHFAEHSFSLKFFLQNAQRLIDIVIPDTYQHYFLYRFGRFGTLQYVKSGFKQAFDVTSHVFHDVTMAAIAETISASVDGFRIMGTDMPSKILF